MNTKDMAVEKVGVRSGFVESMPYEAGEHL